MGEILTTQNYVCDVCGAALILSECWICNNERGYLRNESGGSWSCSKAGWVSTHLALKD